MQERVPHHRPTSHRPTVNHYARIRRQKIEVNDPDCWEGHECSKKSSRPLGRAVELVVEIVAVALINASHG